MDRVLEIGGFAAGYCGRLFAQSGYDVVRVESQPASPGWVSQTASDFYLHAGKRRLITSDPGLIAKLAAEADVVIAEAATADELGARVQCVADAGQGFDNAFWHDGPKAQLASHLQRDLSNGGVYKLNGRSRSRTPYIARALSRIPKWRVRLHSGQRMSNRKAEKHDRHRHARGGDGTESVHHGDVALRQDDSIKAWQRLLDRRTDQLIPVCGRLGIPQHRSNLLGRFRRFFEATRTTNRSAFQK